MMKIVSIWSQRDRIADCVCAMSCRICASEAIIDAMRLLISPYSWMVLLSDEDDEDEDEDEDEEDEEDEEDII